jgi:Domain of Unknown Function with PDB structure (DUF3857)
MRKILLLTISMSLLCIISYAKPPKIKFGKVSEEELQMKKYQKDTTADAVILYDFGDLNFKYNNYKTIQGFQYNFKRHLRIKIFNKDALSYGNLNIYLYHTNSRGENIKAFRAYTYNMKDGKIVKEKVTKKDLLIEEFDKNRDIAKCVMPNVKEGTIVDFEYEVESDYMYYLKEWQFQYTIPVVWSEFKAVIPEFYEYKHYFKGYLELDINDFKSVENESFPIEYEDVQIVNGMSKVVKGKWSLNSSSNVRHFGVEHVPAYKKEPFTPSNENYIFKLFFELSQTKFPRSPVKKYAKSWEAINEELMTEPKFGYIIGPGRLIKKLLPEIVDETDDDQTKMFKIFNYVRDTYKWNDKYRFYATKVGFEGVVKDKLGSSADINLLLIALFKEAGLNAYPVLLSTRSNGMIIPEYPGENAFNYVIAYILNDKDPYFFDATDKFSLPNLVPTRCLNGPARIADKNFSDWVDVNALCNSKKTITGNFDIDTDEGVLIGNLTFLRDNYFAHSIRKSIDKYEDLEEYMDEYKNKNHSMEIEDYSFKGVDTLSLPVESNMELSIEGINMAGDLLYFNPLNIFTGDDNPFKSETRSYPVNFTYPTEEIYIMNYNLPEGYEVNEIPKDVSVELEDKSANFVYTIVQNGNSIQVTLKKNIIKTIFNTDEYSQLRDLFNQMISKQSEQIVLKRKS